MFHKRFKVGVANTQNLESLVAQKDLIESFYIGLPITGNCRSNYILLSELNSFLERCEDIPVWVTANAPVIPPQELNRLIDVMYGTWKQYKFHGYIVSNIVLLKELSARGIPVQVSTVCDIRDLNDVYRYVDMGFNDLVLSYKVNRNMDFINDCVKYFPNTKFSLITNELCESNCPHRYAHFAITSMNMTIKYQCPIRKAEDSSKRRTKLLQNTLIPPENLQYYPEKITFKLPTRMRRFAISDIVKHLKTYAGLREYSNFYKLVGHHIDITKLPKFKIDKEIFKSWLNCKNQCFKCNICEKEVMRHVKEQAKGLLDDTTTIME